MQQKQLLIFDLDGTLLDSALDVHNSINRALALMLRPAIDMQQTKKAIGPGSWELYHSLFGDDRQRLEEFRLHFLSDYEKGCMVHTKPFETIPELLERLSAYHLAVATNKKNTTTQLCLQEAGLAHYFKLVVTPDMVKKIKPEPDMVLFCMDHFTCTAEQTLLIGDTDNDLLAAKSAGVACGLATWGYGNMEENKKLQPDYILTRPLQLLEILDRTAQAAA
jgi:phosphoglycolate phosphatase